MVTGCGTKLGRGLALGIGLLVAGLLCLGLDSNAAAQSRNKKKTTTTKKKTKTKDEEDSPGPVAKVEEGDPIVNSEQVQKINELIAAGWEANNIKKPSSMASTYEWARRVSLDIIGRIPKTDELHKLLSDPPQSRRAAFVERLLASDEYAENWANVWTTWLLTRSGNKLYHEQMQVWLEEQFSKNRPWNKMVAGDLDKFESYKQWADKPELHGLLTAVGDNNENGAVNFILSHLGEATQQAKVPEEGMFNFVPITSRTTRLFLGEQVQCSQCHDHPFNPVRKQRNFWGVNAFFRQVVREGDPMMRNNQRGMAPPKLSLVDKTNINPNEMVFYETRKAVVLATRPTFLDGKKFDGKGNPVRRIQLGKYVTEHNEFAKAFVVRYWAHFMGRAPLVNGKDMDDFGEHNQETHPELVNYLAKEFIASGYDIKKLITWIANSKPYNLTSVANGQVEATVEKVVDGKKVQAKEMINNDKADHDPWFSRMQLKAMSPEQLFNSLWVSTYDNPRATVKKAKADRDKLREEWMNRLVVSFGDDEGNETTFNGTVIQALMLMNGNEINNAIVDKDGPVESAIKYAQRNGRATTILDELYLATLSRRPSPEEVKRIREDIRPVLTKEKNMAAPWHDLMWALLNSSEFILNH